MENTIYHIEKDGYYMCGCGYHSHEPDITHYSKTIKGYCTNGMQAIEGNKYKCVCGKIIHDSILGNKHCYSGICMENAKRYELFTCKICDIECHSAYYLKKHNESKRHLNKTDQPLLCKICNIRCTTKEKYEYHLTTKKHKRLSVETPLDLECKTCNIKCLSQAQMKVHLQTKKHKKNETSCQNVI